MIPRFRLSGSAPIVASMFAALLLAGCATQETATEEASGEPAADVAVESVSDMPVVFFLNVEDGETYPTEFEIIFVVQNFEIVPVEDPLVPRPGEGHFHLAVDVDCAPAGEIIPAGSPSYIHFGDGSDRITMQFEPGQHSLCLQVADGEHRVIDGPTHSNLTREIRIMVEGE